MKIIRLIFFAILVLSVNVLSLYAQTSNSQGHDDAEIVAEQHIDVLRGFEVVGEQAQAGSDG